MSIMHNLRERRPFNYFDCLFYGAGAIRRGLTSSSTRLFGNCNIGNMSLANIVIAGQFPGDSSAIVSNWYARTNIPAGPLRDALFNPVMATLIVGDHPMRNMSVADLLKREEGTRLELPEHDSVERNRMMDRLAGRAYEAIHPGSGVRFPSEEMLSGPGEDLGPDMPGPDAPAAWPVDRATSEAPWKALDQSERDRWISAAEAICSEINPAPFVIIPVRQNYSVQVDIFNLERFNDSICKLDDPNWDIDGNRLHLLSAPKGHPADRPGLWIHLEGWETRDVC